jgi:hypothetical protein
VDSVNCSIQPDAGPWPEHPQVTTGRRLDKPEAGALITLVIRLWQGGSPGFRLEATHVQTGEVAYFRTIEDVAHHLDRLAQALIKQPIDLSEARRRSNSHG